MVEVKDVKELRVDGGIVGQWAGDGCIVQRVCKEYAVARSHAPAITMEEYRRIVHANDEAVGLDDMGILLSTLTEMFGDDNIAA